MHHRDVIRRSSSRLHPTISHVRAREWRVSPRRISDQFAEPIGALRLLLWRTEPRCGGCEELRHFGRRVRRWAVGWGRGSRR